MKKHWKLTVYLLGFLVLAVTLAACQPLKGMQAPPDEVYRYLVPQYIYSHGSIPTGLEEEIRIPSYGFSYALYNVFPYIVMGLAMRVTGLITQAPEALLLTARLMNVLAGLTMAWVVYLLSRRLFEKERSRWLFCLAVTFQPMNVFIHSYVNTDSFCMLSTALIVYGLVRLYQEKPDLKSCLWIAAGVILCALSYYSAYGYILAAVILFIAAFARKGAFDFPGFLKYAGITAGIVLAGIGWWFVRQYIVLDGDFLGLRTRDALTVAYGKPAVQAANTFAGQGYSFFGMLKEMLARQLPVKLAGTLIAAYGSLTLKPGIWYYALYGLVWLAGLAGLILRAHQEDQPQSQSARRELAVASSPRLFRLIRSPRFRKSGQPTGLPLGSLTHGTVLFHGCMVLCMLLPLLLYLRYCYATDYQEQGRYLLPALVPAMYYITKGLERWGKAAVVCAGTVIVFCAVWQVYAMAVPAFM